MNLDVNAAWKVTKQMIESAGDVSWLTNYPEAQYLFFNNQRKWYERILTYYPEKSAWMTSGENLSKWVHHGD